MSNESRLRERRTSLINTRIETCHGAALALSLSVKTICSQWSKQEAVWARWFYPLCSSLQKTSVKIRGKWKDRGCCTWAWMRGQFLLLLLLLRELVWLQFVPFLIWLTLPVLRQEARARCQGCGADGVKEGYCVTEVSSGNHSHGVKKLFKATRSLISYFPFSVQSCTS